MTKEELEKEAEESFEQYKVTDEDYVVSPYSDDMGEKMLMFNYEYEVEEDYLRLYTQGYLAGAEPREKQIVELKGLVNQYKASKCSGISIVNRNMIMSDQLTKAKGIIKIMKHLLFDVWGYIDIPFEERVNKFLSEVGK